MVGVFWLQIKKPRVIRSKDFFSAGGKGFRLYAFFPIWDTPSGPVDTMELPAQELVIFERHVLRLSLKVIVSIRQNGDI